MSETRDKIVLHGPDGRWLPGHNPLRQAGQPSIVGRIREKCDEMGFDWVVEAINRFRDPKVPHADRTQCLQMIADRLAPKLKAIEVKSADNAAMQQVLINIIGADPVVDVPAVVVESKPTGELT